MASSSMLSTFIAHPSVRMKGTEDNWHPVNCNGIGCDSDYMGVHMHCPLCTKEVNYTDPVILKAHYRVKHVDKGVEFAGLKVLRCCRNCEIIGVISALKNFKGPHWHCYRCRNGFNRRDEALKHFKTHFKNPQTTFQIQIVQDLNQSFASMEAQQHASSVGQNLEMDTTSTTIALPNLCAQPQHGNKLITVAAHHQETAIATNGISVAANETIDSNTDTIVLIETSDGTLPPSIHSIHTNAGNFPAFLQQSNSSPSPADNQVYKANLLLIQEKMKLEQKIEQLQRDKLDMEHRLKSENQRLKAKIDQLTIFNANLKQQMETLRKASTEHIPDHDQSELEQLLKHMTDQHSNLVRHHLDQLRMYMNNQQQGTESSQSTSVNTGPSADHQQQSVQIIPVVGTDALEHMMNDSGDAQQNLNLTQIETADGSYHCQVTLLPEVSVGDEESGQDLGETVQTDASVDSEMTTLSCVDVPFSDTRTLGGESQVEEHPQAGVQVESSTQLRTKGQQNSDISGNDPHRGSEADEPVAKRTRAR